MRGRRPGRPRMRRALISLPLWRGGGCVVNHNNAQAHSLTASIICSNFIVRSNQECRVIIVNSLFTDGFCDSCMRFSAQFFYVLDTWELTCSILISTEMSVLKSCYNVVFYLNVISFCWETTKTFTNDVKTSLHSYARYRLKMVVSKNLNFGQFFRYVCFFDRFLRCKSLFLQSFYKYKSTIYNIFINTVRLTYL